MIRWHEASDAIGYAVTDRLGGVSQGPYAGCNLGDHVGDDPVAVRANRAAVLRALGHADLDLVLMDQVHGADVAVLDAPPPQPPRTDAIVTGLAGVVFCLLRVWSDSLLAPMGLRLRLKRGYDISRFGPQTQVILRAAKRYGVIVADNGSAGFISGAPSPGWDDDDLHALGEITAADLEVVDTRGLRDR